MRREDLRNQGLTEEQINFVMQQNGIDIENAANNDERLAAERNRAEGLQAQLDTLTADLTAARNSAAGAADLRRQLDEANARYQASVKANAIRDALTGHKVRDAGMFARLLDDSKITMDKDGKLTGLDEQVIALKESSGYLFTDTPADKGGNPGAGNTGDNFDMNAFLRG